MPTTHSPLWTRLLLLGLVLAAIIRAWHDRWTCDDAFVSFRYAENLINGYGLVFNPGEPPVEGYTNVLWNLLAAGALALGIDAVMFGYIFGIGCYVATILLLARLSRRLGATSTLPIAAGALALQEHSSTFSTCGLETSLFTLVVTASFAVIATARTNRAFFWLGLLTVLTMLTRIDGAIIAAVCGVWTLLAARERRSLTVVLLFSAPWLAIYLPYFAWRFDYYGYFFPNIYYAKSASEPYFSQGIEYLGLYFQCYYILVISVMLTAAVAVRRSMTQSAAVEGSLIDHRRFALLILSFSLPYLAYVAWVGGDFMFARFCLPVTPALLLGLDLWSVRLSTNRNRVLFGVSAILATVLMWYPSGMQVGDTDNPMVVEERSFYPRERMEGVREAGNTLREILQDTTARVVIESYPQCTLAYFARFPYVLETTGLADVELARQPLQRRGRPGHEHSADAATVLERRINFYFTEQEIPDSLGSLGLRDLDLRGIPAKILVYDRGLMDPLKDLDGVQFHPFDEYLDDYIRTIATRSKPQVIGDYQAFRVFYFNHNVSDEDMGRREAIEGYLR